MNPILRGYLRLCRPPNLPTAAADILAGLAIIGAFSSPSWPVEALFLVVSSIFLYAGGVVFNDFFDYEIDLVERPERPLPSGTIPLKNAAIFGALLMLTGLLLATLVSIFSGVVALVLILTILLYDSWGKNHSFFGPLNMGLCRGLNLLLGMSLVQTFDYWQYALIPVLFIFAVTLISRGEVHGNNKKNIIFAGVLYGLVLISVMLLNNLYGVEQFGYLLFLGLFAIMVLIPLIRAYRENIPKNIMKAVKAGVLSIILLDAAIASAFAGLQIGLLIVLLLPLSILLAKAFAVT
ncbi:UbiA-like protein EboC [Croceivirga thetidis]|uniref:UbiA-like protein EboC n=1 Tax=Croceivirga thetidis TaxID=2721623 RepID=A0ABX1GS95_9FLAO|nr:UbiA-like protein EboC [Croceivirga thetidis]NKI31931.1 UbiA-like protein EboC [Croceivirga thetidis]